eukprot:3360007-Amphidinium_carterae.1
MATILCAHFCTPVLRKGVPCLSRCGSSPVHANLGMAMSSQKKHSLFSQSDGDDKSSNVLFTARESDPTAKNYGCLP